MNLCLVTYAVDLAVAAEHVPPGLECDQLPELPGKALVSLVAFDFLDTRVKGLRIPRHVNFPEVNLRLYVRDPRDGAQGVVFVREFVHRRAIAWVARWVYNEPYRVAEMSSRLSRADGQVRVEHQLNYAGTNATITMGASGEKAASLPDSRDRFFTQRLWGFGRTRGGRTLRYRVDHPIWELHRDAKAAVSLDFGAIYGGKWGVLNAMEPVSTILAEGSAVTVMPHSMYRRRRMV